MTTQRLLLLLVGTCFAFGLVFAPDVEGVVWQRDNNPPQLTDISFNPASVDVSARSAEVIVQHGSQR